MLEMCRIMFHSRAVSDETIGDVLREGENIWREHKFRRKKLAVCHSQGDRRAKTRGMGGSSRKRPEREQVGAASRVGDEVLVRAWLAWTAGSGRGGDARPFERMIALHRRRPWLGRARGD